MSLLSVVKETNTWLSTNTLIKRGQYSAVQSNTHFELNRLIIHYQQPKFLLEITIIGTIFEKFSASLCSASN